MAIGHVLLGLLATRAQHGYDLKSAHDQIFPAARPLAYGQVYATLGRLAKRGQVETMAAEQVGGPERVVYRITDDGRSELQQWLSELEAPAPFVANPLATKVTIALLDGGQASAQAYLEAQRAAHLDRMRHYTRQKTAGDGDLTTVLATDYALAHLAADIEWLDLALQRIDMLAADVLSRSTEPGETR